MGRHILNPRSKKLLNKDHIFYLFKVAWDMDIKKYQYSFFQNVNFLSHQKVLGNNLKLQIFMPSPHFEVGKRIFSDFFILCTLKTPLPQSSLAKKHLYGILWILNSFPNLSPVVKINHLSCFGVYRIFTGTPKCVLVPYTMTKFWKE
jgi:hypothetical protein